VVATGVPIRRINDLADGLEDLAATVSAYVPRQMQSDPQQRGQWTPQEAPQWLSNFLARGEVAKGIRYPSGSGCPGAWTAWRTPAHWRVHRHWGECIVTDFAENGESSAEDEGNDE